jgi:multidrug efflux pump subunit AcrA (membrane-fusion protein)
VGELVGVASPTQLACIVQLDPIYVNFNGNEQDVLRIRAEAARKELTASDLKQLRIEVGLQTESSYPHKGELDYAAPTINQSTGTLAVRDVLPNAERVLLPGYFVHVRVPLDEQPNALLVPDIAPVPIKPGDMSLWSPRKTSSSSVRSKRDRSTATCASSKAA